MFTYEHFNITFRRQELKYNDALRNRCQNSKLCRQCIPQKFEIEVQVHTFFCCIISSGHKYTIQNLNMCKPNKPKQSLRIHCIKYTRLRLTCKVKRSVYWRFHIVPNDEPLYCSFNGGMVTYVNEWSMPCFCATKLRRFFL